MDIVIGQLQLNIESLFIGVALGIYLAALSLFVGSYFRSKNEK